MTDDRHREPDTQKPEPAPEARPVHSHTEGIARAHALVVADLGDPAAAERLLVEAGAEHPGNSLAGDLLMVRDHVAGLTRAQLAAEQNHPGTILGPELTMLEFTQLTRQNDHGVAFVDGSTVLRHAAVLSALLLAATALTGWWPVCLLALPLVAVRPWFTARPAVRQIRAGVGQAVPAIRRVQLACYAVTLVMVALTGAVIAGAAIPPVLLALAFLAQSGASLAYLWAGIAATPPERRADHWALRHGDEPILEEARRTKHRPGATLVLLVLVAITASCLGVDDALGSYAGAGVVGASASALTGALGFWWRRLGRGPLSFAADPAEQPLLADDLSAAVPVVVAALGLGLAVVGR